MSKVRQAPDALEVIARRLCQGDGFDPDAVTHPDDPYSRKPLKVVLDVAIPSWWNYRKAADAILSALREAGYVVAHREARPSDNDVAYAEFCMMRASAKAVGRIAAMIAAAEEVQP